MKGKASLKTLEQRAIAQMIKHLGDPAILIKDCPADLGHLFEDAIEALHKERGGMTNAQHVAAMDRVIDALNEDLARVVNELSDDWVSEANVRQDLAFRVGFALGAAFGGGR